MTGASIDSGSVARLTTVLVTVLVRVCGTQRRAPDAG